MLNVSETQPKFEKSRLYEFDENLLRRLKRLIAVGDLHGDYDSLSSLLRAVDLAEDGIVFLGDYADRGSNGVEVIDRVGYLTGKYPQNVVALKGNHEDYSDSGHPRALPCDLINEVELKKGDWQVYFQRELKPFIEKLYLAAIVPREVLFVHGGVSSKIRSLDDLRYPTREVEMSILWSDPFEGDGERRNFDRGAGVEFGRDITQEVCRELGVKRIIRSHEPKKAHAGPYYEHDGGVITINSTNAYGGKPFYLVINPVDLSDFSSYFL